MSEYEFYLKAIANKDQIGVTIPVHESEPQSGRYRMRDVRLGDMIPVAIWTGGTKDDPLMVAKVGDKMVDAIDVWTYCCRNPVTDAEYNNAMAGNGWPDTPPENEIAGIGHNMPDDPFDAIMLELKGEQEAAKDFLAKPIDTEQRAQTAANWSKRVAGISKRADELFTVEKRPHLDAGKAVDDKWRGVREDAKALTQSIKRSLDAYLKAQHDKEMERQRVAREQETAARLKAEEAAKKAQNVQSNPDDPEALQAQREAEKAAEELKQAQREAEAKSIAVGRTGSKVTLKTEKSALIEDFDKLLNALKDREEIKTLVQSLANRAAKANVQLAGMKIVETQKAV